MFTKISDEFYLRLDDVVAIELNGGELNVAFAGHDGFIALMIEPDAYEALEKYLEDRSHKWPLKYYGMEDSKP